MTQACNTARRFFLKATAACAVLAAAGVRTIGVARAAAMDFVGKRQQGVYAADAKVYALRKSQDNPMITKIYAKDGFLADGPCGHNSHELLHTHYTDRSAGIAALKAKGVKLKV